MKKIVFLVVFFILYLPTWAQEETKLFSEAVRTNFSHFKRQSNKAFKEGDFERGQFLFDSLVQNQLIGSKFNDYTLKRVSNRKLKMSKLKKPIFLITYAAWCVPGKGEIPALNKLAKEFHNEIEFIVIVFGKKQEVKKFSSKFNHHIEVCYAHKNYRNDNEIVENMKETLGFPTVYMMTSDLQLIDIKRGIVVAPLKTPLKKAIELNYLIYKERLAQLNTNFNKKETLVIY